LHTGVVGGRTRRRIETLVGVPVVTAVGPRQFGGERAKDVVQRLGDDDVVIDGHQSVQHDVPDADTYIRQPTRRAIRSSHADTHKHTHTHTHPHFTCSSLDFARDNPGELVPEGTFHHLLDFLVQNEDNTGRHTNNPDGLPPIQTNWCPISAIPTDSANRILASFKRQLNTHLFQH